MLDDAQRAEVEEIVARLVPTLVAEEVAKQLAEQLAGLGVTPPPPPQTDRVPHTVWEGEADKDFVFDPPDARRHNLLIARRTTGEGSFHVTQYVQSEFATRAIADEEVQGSAIFVVPPGVTHLGIHDTLGCGWRIEVADLDELPDLALPAAGEEGAVFAHRLGLALVLIRSADTVTVSYYEPCDCGSQCSEKPHTLDRKSTRLNSSHERRSRMPSSA